MKHAFEKCATCGESIYTWPSGRKECLPQHRLYIVRQALKEINAVRFHSRSIGSPVPEGTANLRRAVDKTTGKAKDGEQPKRILPLTVMPHSTIRAQEIIAATLKKAGVCGSESLADLVVKALCNKTFTCPSCHGIDPNCDICYGAGRVEQMKHTRYEVEDELNGE